MSLEIVFPPVLEQEVRSLAEREGLSTQDFVSLVLELSTVLLKPGKETPLRRAVHDFYPKRGLNISQVSQVLSDLLRIASQCDIEARLNSSEATNGNVNIVPILERTLETWAHILAKPRLSAFGKYAHLPGGSEEFMREKHEELAREEAQFDKELPARRLRDPGVPA